MIDGPQNGPAPGPWDIAAQPNGMFSNHDKSFEVPHTASVKSCHNCMGVGMNRCWRCHGRGRVSHVTVVTELGKPLSSLSVMMAVVVGNLVRGRQNFEVF